MPRLTSVAKTTLIVALMGLTGCSGLDHMERKLDMASERLESSRPEYEGTVSSAKRIGAMTALQFMDGKLYDVSDCPAHLVSGDIVRVYKTENGYDAHLWKSRDNHIPVLIGTATPTTPQMGS